MTTDYIDKIILYLDSTPTNSWVEIRRIAANPAQFIETIKLCIDELHMPYEFNQDYTKLRRYAPRPYSSR